MRYAARVMGSNGRFAWLGPPPYYPYVYTRTQDAVIGCYGGPVAMSKKQCLEAKSIIPDTTQVEIMRYPAARVVHRLAVPVFNGCVKIDKVKYESIYGKEAILRISPVRPGVGF